LSEAKISIFFERKFNGKFLTMKRQKEIATKGINDSKRNSHKQSKFAIKIAFLYLFSFVQFVAISFKF